MDSWTRLCLWNLQDVSWHNCGVTSHRSVEILHWSAELLRWAGIDVPWRCIFKFVHKRKMLYHLHKCIAYHQSSWVTLYLVHSLRVDTFSSDGSYFMIYVLLVEWYVFVLFMFDVLFYDILLMPFLFCHLQVKRNQNEISKIFI